MHTKGRFRNLLFDSNLHPGSAALAILVMLLFLLFILLFMTFAAQPVQGQTSAFAQNPVPPTARQTAAMPQYASRLAHPAAPQATGKSRARTPAGHRTPLPQDQVIYENGPANGTTDAWTINFGYIVSDSISLSGNTVTGFDFYTWEFSGDVLSSVDWSITSAENGGTVYGSGTASGSNITDTFISTNQFGYDIDKVTVTGLNVSPSSGTSWINLQNASVPSGDPVYWDENSGAGCQSSGCPSQAYESSVGTIPSEAFDIVGSSSGPPACIFDDPKDGFKIIYSFTAQEGGKQGPNSGVAVDKAGSLYGSVGDGGDYGQGLVYKLAQTASGWIFNPLYSFAGGANGADPGQVVVGPEGGLYGGTAGGGVQNCGSGGTSSCGLVYGLRPQPTACLTALCSWMENVLYPFSGNTDAWAGEVSGFDQRGNLFGFSPEGGAYGHGAVFELTPSNGGWTEEVIYSFTGSDGDGVNALLVAHDGKLYGTTFTGGHGGGAVFQLVPSGDGWTEQLIAGFPGCTYYNGCSPVLVQENSGNLYGVNRYDRYFWLQYYGFWDQFGQIFMMSPTDGKWQVTVIDDTCNYYRCWEGMEDSGYDLFYDLAIDDTGKVYATEGGGFPGIGSGYWWGNVLEVVGSGGRQDKFLVGFSGDNFSNVEVGASGKLYGTTSGCGTYGKGTVWQLTPQQ